MQLTIHEGSQIIHFNFDSFYLKTVEYEASSSFFELNFRMSAKLLSSRCFLKASSLYTYLITEYMLLTNPRNETKTWLISEYLIKRLRKLYASI
jgi:hypothetical protein